MTHAVLIEFYVNLVLFEVITIPSEALLHSRHFIQFQPFLIHSYTLIMNGKMDGQVTEETKTQQPNETDYQRKDQRREVLMDGHTHLI